MPPQLLIALMIVVLLPIAWLASEFGTSRVLRLTLGLAAILSSFGVAYVVGELNRLNYNAWYGGATGDLISTMIAEIEDGNTDRVMKVLKRIDVDYKPTYETRAHYDEIIAAAVRQMKGEDERQ